MATFEDLLAEAEQCMAHHQWRTAESLLTQAIEMDPNDYSLFVNRSEVYLRRKLHAEALQDAAVAIRLDPLNPAGYQVRGNVYFEQAKYALAITAFKEGLAKAPGNEKLRQYVSLCVAASAAAGDDYLEELRTLVSRGDAAFNGGRYRKATRYYSRAIDKDPTEAALYMRRAVVYLKRQQNTSALADVEEVVRLQPSPDAYRYKAGVLRGLNRFEEAVQAYQQGLALAPTDPALLMSLQETVETLGRLDPVRQQFSDYKKTALAYCAYDGASEDFCRSEFPSLRTLQHGLDIQLALTITVYNETGDELARTLRAIAVSRIPALSWREMVIVVVCDGRSKLHREMRHMAEEFGIFDSSRIQAHQKRTTMHTFETNAVQLYPHKPPIRMQVLFLVKEYNAGKLNSHDWFFRACEHRLRPKYTFLIDVGTSPSPTALGALFRALDEDPHLGGVCGEIAVESPRMTSLVESSQHFEYKISHVMDKAMESMLGFVSVLPGAFSAYRYKAILGAPLDAYFRLVRGEASEVEKIRSSAFLSNMYLAEDRIMAFELLVKEDCRYTLRYITGAVAYTDVPTTIVALTKQRRRWLNGSFFASIYVLIHWRRLFRSAHSCLRKAVLLMEFFFMAVNAAVTWVLLANAYVAVMVASDMALGHTNYGIYVTNFYLLLITLLLMFSMGNRPDSIQTVYKVISAMFGVLLVFSMAMLIVVTFQGAVSARSIIAVFCLFGASVFCAFLHGELGNLSAASVQYFLMVPTFINMFTIFAFCNMHDVSWGTRPANDFAHGAAPAAGAATGGAAGGGGTVAAVARAREQEEAARRNALMEKQREAQREETFARFRSTFMGSWLVSQVVYVTFARQVSHYPWFTWMIVLFAAFLIGCKVVGSIVYQWDTVQRLLAVLLAPSAASQHTLRRSPSFLSSLRKKAELEAALRDAKHEEKRKRELLTRVVSVLTQHTNDGGGDGGGGGSGSGGSAPPLVIPGLKRAAARARLAVNARRAKEGQALLSSSGNGSDSSGIGSGLGSSGGDARAAGTAVPRLARPPPTITIRSSSSPAAAAAAVGGAGGSVSPDTPHAVLSAPDTHLSVRRSLLHASPPPSPSSLSFSSPSSLPPLNNRAAVAVTPPLPTSPRRPLRTATAAAAATATASPLPSAAIVLPQPLEQPPPPRTAFSATAVAAATAPRASHPSHRASAAAPVGSSSGGRGSDGDLIVPRPRPVPSSFPESTAGDGYVVAIHGDGDTASTLPVAATAPPASMGRSSKHRGSGSGSGGGSGGGGGGKSGGGGTRKKKRRKRHTADNDAPTAAAAVAATTTATASQHRSTFASSPPTASSAAAAAAAAEKKGEEGWEGSVVGASLDGLDFVGAGWDDDLEGAAAAAPPPATTTRGAAVASSSGSGSSGSGFAGARLPQPPL